MRSPVLWMENLKTKSSAPSAALEVQREAQKLPPRRMHESYTQVILKLKSDPDLLEKYVNASGGIRTGMYTLCNPLYQPTHEISWYTFLAGKIMEHLDSLAGSIAYKYVLGPSVERLESISEAGLYIVTASIDR